MNEKYIPAGPLSWVYKKEIDVYSEHHAFPDLRSFYMIGKGPSLDRLQPRHFPNPWPVFCVNQSIHKIETLGLPNPLFVVQQDAYLEDKCRPSLASTQMLVSPKETTHYPERSCIVVTDKELIRHCMPTWVFVCHHLKRKGAKSATMYAFDALIDGVCDYANCIGHTPDARGPKTRFLNQKKYINAVGIDLHILPVL